MSVLEPTATMLMGYSRWYIWCSARHTVGNHHLYKQDVKKPQTMRRPLVGTYIFSEASAVGRVRGAAYNLDFGLPLFRTT